MLIYKINKENFRQARNIIIFISYGE